MSGDDIHFLLHLRNQIKLYHWQTRTYARHIATDKLLDDIDSIIDKYVEVYMGKYGRPKMTTKNNTIKLLNLSETSIIRCIKHCIAYLKSDLIKGLSPQDTDLINIRDEMLSDLDQLLYLFTLK